MEILNVNNLNVRYTAKKNGKKKESHIVKDVSFTLNEGECLVILGESGSGKSMTLKSVMGLLDMNFKIEGSAMFNGIDLTKESKENLRKLRGKEMTMILQNPMTCFDSLYRIDYQIAETFQEHTDWSKEEIYAQSIKALEKMMINNPAEVLKRYPHQLSGGMLQRVMIAVALTLNPKVLVADEPTTAIDAITQFEIMKEFQRLKDNKTTMIFITHDLGVASLIADKVMVMNKGEVVDRGTFKEIIENPKDNYTKLLVEKRISVMKQYKEVLGIDTKETKEKQEDNSND